MILIGGGKRIVAILSSPGREREPTCHRRYAYFSSVPSGLAPIVVAGYEDLVTERVNAIINQAPDILSGRDQPARLSRVNATTLSVALVAAIGWFDYVTGDFSLALFYLVPVAIAAWYAGRVEGWFVGLLSATAWLVGDLARNPSDGHALMPYWNAATFALIYGVVAQLLLAFHRLQAELEERVEQRTALLAKANAELEAARMHFIEADKLESIGRLAAGIAHEVKNPLMTITMVVDYMSSFVPPAEPDGAAMIRALRDAVERANRVIGEMLEFTRPSALTLQPDNFHTVAERALGLVKLELSRKRLNVVRDWCEPAPRLLLDRNKMEQVLVNVFLNAIQAMPEEGTLTLRTRGSAASFTAEIDDTGTGISSRHQIKLFEPFFTTKPAGQGTGLGLSVARQIVQLHSGTLHLTNRAEGGARVTIQIPSPIQTKP